MSLTAPKIGLVLDLDPDLGAGIARAEWETARHDCRGMVARVPRGGWDPRDVPSVFGVVIVDGMLCRETALRDRRMLEILGPGDIVHPPLEGDRPSLAGDLAFTVLTELMVVGLGPTFLQAAARWPSLLAELHRRLESQRERLAVQALIAYLPRAEHRLLLALRHLADRWGRVTPEGVLLPLSLTHDLLGHMVAASRPTVTLAASSLESRGLIERVEGGWWLLRPAADAMVRAIAISHSKRTGALGEALMLRQRASETASETRALQAEARQILGRRWRSSRW